MSVTGRVAGQVLLATLFVGLIALIGSYCGMTPAVAFGLGIGTLVGLVSLVAEIAIVGRSMRLVAVNGMGATLQTFSMRLVTVTALGGWFIVNDAVDAQAFCLSYFTTFFVYLCWLTWRSYTAPVMYQGGGRDISELPASGSAAPASAPAVAKAQTIEEVLAAFEGVER